jgi:LysM repeat protein
MKPVLWIPASCALALALSSCGNTGSSGSQHAGTGPFDRNGRYVEEWADNPSKWGRGGNTPSPHELKSDEVPEIAKNEQPPQNANPLAPSPPSKPTPIISQTQATSKPKPKSTVKESPTTTVKSKPIVHESEPEVVKPKSKPKPKPVVKAKPKPKSTRYVVKSGDSLSSIASRTGSSVSAIKSANDISGNLIRPGQSLTIPKK